MSRGREHTGRAPPEGIEVSYPLPIPPSVTHITRFRVAGNKNEGEIFLLLIRGRWDSKTRTHIKEGIVFRSLSHQREEQRAQSRASHSRALVEGNSTHGGVVGGRRVRLLRGAPEEMFHDG